VTGARAANARRKARGTGPRGARRLLTTRLGRRCAPQAARLPASACAAARWPERNRPTLRGAADEALRRKERGTASAACARARGHPSRRAEAPARRNGVARAVQGLPLAAGSTARRDARTVTACRHGYRSAATRFARSYDTRFARSRRRALSPPSETDPFLTADHAQLTHRRDAAVCKPTPQRCITLTPSWPSLPGARSRRRCLRCPWRAPRARGRRTCG